MFHKPTTWAPQSYSNVKIGLFGASTGAGAALVAAANPQCPISCVVSRGGRVDLAEASLSKVTCPVLCIVGGQDMQVMQWNKKALLQIPAKRTQVCSQCKESD